MNKKPVVVNTDSWREGAWVAEKKKSADVAGRNCKGSWRESSVVAEKKVQW